jgi:hypothetical protein
MKRNAALMMDETGFEDGGTSRRRGIALSGALDFL